MTTRILDLPLIDWELQTATNEDWLDALQFTDALSPLASVLTGSITTGTNLVTNLASTLNLLPGQAVYGPGIQVGSIIEAILSATSIRLNIVAVETNFSAVLTFNPIPIDLTGISFRSQMRSAPEDPLAALNLSTENGRLINGETSGVLALKVPVTAIALIQPGEYDQDIIAIADGLQRRVSIMKVTIQRGITR